MDDGIASCCLSGFNIGTRVILLPLCSKTPVVSITQYKPVFSMIYQTSQWSGLPLPLSYFFYSFPTAFIPNFTSINMSYSHIRAFVLILLSSWNVFLPIYRSRSTRHTQTLLLSLYSNVTFSRIPLQATLSKILHIPVPLPFFALFIQLIIL